MMQKLTLADVKDPAQYEREREHLRREIIALKRLRRIAVGSLLSFVFENRETVLFQVHETLRAERITDVGRAQEELDVYNTLIPEKGELSATLFIEFKQQDALRVELTKLIGVDEAVILRVGRHEIKALSEPGRSTAEKTATVHYLRFPLTQQAHVELASMTSNVWLVVDHSYYGASTRLSVESLHELAKDLR